MGFFRVLVVVSCFLVVLGTLLPQHNAVEPLQELMTVFQKNVLQSRNNEGRSLTHNATRRVYLQVLSEAEKMIAGSNAAADQKALTCSLLRSEARRFARSLDGTYGGHLTDVALQLRDVYVHALRFFPVALRLDIRDSMALQKPTLYHVALAVREAFSCLAPALSQGQCPSYSFLREVREKSDDDILGACTKANKAYNGF